MAIALVQSAQNSAKASSVTVTYTAPAEGNLMVLAVFACRGDNSEPSISTPSGWTAATAQTQNTQSGQNGAALRMFYKIAGAGEGTSVSPGATNVNVVGGLFAEFSGNHATPLDVAQTNIKTTSSDNTISTGTTAATSESGELAVAAALMHDANSTGATWSNSFTAQEFRDMDHGNPGNEMAGALAYKLNVSGTQETTGTFTSGPNSEAMGHIATFKAAATGWAGKIVGVTDPAKVNGIAVANIAKIDNVA